ncbi:MAG: putative DnaC [Candidatus Improbicoccus devescovinae]|nr:MAG: putative DnaC [Candidatus Improbicoccus devescovinae]
MEKINEKICAQSIRNEENIANSRSESGDDLSAQICPVCGENLFEMIKNWRNIFEPKSDEMVKLRRNCKCERDRQELEAKRRTEYENLQKFKRLKSLSLLGKRYENISFESTQTSLNSSFDVAFNRCKKFCENYKIILAKGNGIYLFGDKGIGKTHLTACMANELMKNGVPVLFTNLFEISKSVKATFRKDSFETEKSLFEKFSKTEVLFFDDLGTEIFSKNEEDTWFQGLLFDIINQRYNANKSTIFSSNYSLNSLINERNIAERTVDRLCEMTSGAQMKIEEKSWRNRQMDLDF